LSRPGISEGIIRQYKPKEGLANKSTKEGGKARRRISSSPAWAKEGGELICQDDIERQGSSPGPKKRSTKGQEERKG